MKKQYQSIIAFFLLFATAYLLKAQTGCPGCVIQLPSGLAADTVFIESLPDGNIGKPYDEDVSFRMPKTTTPVHSIDSLTPPGLPITKIEILSVEGLPLGLKWQTNQSVFETGAGKTDGCVKICGTPLEDDSFLLTIKIKATVIVLSQESSFNMRLYIAPKKKITDGFTMSGYEGCGPLLVQFTNNVPSKGKTGFAYRWDFGDGKTYEGENPPAHLYDKPGKYPVQYLATVDTSGLILESVRILKVDCSDVFNGPDIYVHIKNSKDSLVFNSSPDISDASFPLTIAVNLPIGNGNYQLEVWDEDSGFKGPDDGCGSFPFNALSGDTVNSNGLRVVLNMKRHIDTVLSVDTVHVFPAAEKPLLDIPFGLKACAGVDSVVLISSIVDGIQWLRNGVPVPGAIRARYVPKVGGWYKAQHTNAFGCGSVSDSVQVSVNQPPLTPVYRNDRNLLVIENPPGLPPAFTYQWFLGNNPIPGETRPRYCAKQGGVIGVVVTNIATGCSSFYATAVALDPAGVDCTIDAEEAAPLVLGLFPNPVSERLYARWNRPLPSEGALRFWDATGRLMLEMPLNQGADNAVLELPKLPQGLYWAELKALGMRAVGKVLVD